MLLVTLVYIIACPHAGSFEIMCANSFCAVAEIDTADDTT